MTNYLHGERAFGRGGPRVDSLRRSIGRTPSMALLPATCLCTNLALSQAAVALQRLFAWQCHLWPKITDSNAFKLLMTRYPEVCRIKKRMINN